MPYIKCATISVRTSTKKRIFNEVSESEPSQIYDEDPTETENMTGECI